MNEKKNRESDVCISNGHQYFRLSQISRPEKWRQTNQQKVVDPSLNKGHAFKSNLGSKQRADVLKKVSQNHCSSPLALSFHITKVIFGERKLTAIRKGVNQKSLSLVGEQSQTQPCTKPDVLNFHSVQGLAEQTNSAHRNTNLFSGSHMSLAHTRIKTDVSTMPKCQQNTRCDFLNKTWHLPGQFWPSPALLVPHCQDPNPWSRQQTCSWGTSWKAACWPWPHSVCPSCQANPPARGPSAYPEMLGGTKRQASIWSH